MMMDTESSSLFVEAITTSLGLGLALGAVVAVNTNTNKPNQERPPGVTGRVCAHAGLRTGQKNGKKGGNRLKAGRGGPPGTTALHTQNGSCPRPQPLPTAFVLAKMVCCCYGAQQEPFAPMPLPSHFTALGRGHSGD